MPERAPDPQQDPWCRDWELLFRCADATWARVGEHPTVLKLRREFADRFGFPLVPCSDNEAARFSSQINPIIETTAERWVTLFSAWYGDRQRFIFPDGYSTLFLTRVLWSNQTVLYRGHFDAKWKLTSSWSRQRQTHTDDSLQKKNEQFLTRLRELPMIRECYMGQRIAHANQRVPQLKNSAPTKVVSGSTLAFLVGGTADDCNRQ